MPDLRHTRKKIQTALAIMLGIDVVAAAILFSPLVGSTESRRQELDSLRSELQIKTREVEPLRNIDQKIKVAHQQIDDFYQKRFPAQHSEIVAEFGKLAAADGVTIATAKYPVKDAGPRGLQRVEIDADLAGNYESLARFINALERDEILFIINSVMLGGEQQGPVKLNVKLETYLKASGQ